MTGALHHQLTPTQRASHERSKAFKAKIAEQAARLRMKPEFAVVTAAPVVVPAPGTFWFKILPGYRPTVDMICRAACDYYSIAKNDLLSERRPRELVRPRQIVMYLAKDLTRLSYPKIGRFMGGLDHTTILHGVKTIARLVRSDLEIAFDVAELFRAITGDPTGETCEANPHL